ncbi:MAG: histone deacetylase [Bacteriovoracia bacterium]
MDWSRIKLYYTDHIELPLPPGHRFPNEKYRRLREALLESGVVHPGQLVPGPEASLEDLFRAHDERYVRGFKAGTLAEKEIRPIGLPWSQELYLRSASGAGGLIKASEEALVHGYSGLLAGGTHHAHRSHGEGYCVFNDFAVAILTLLAKRKIQHALVLDLDVHQGNGNSSILGSRSDVFVCSLHGEKNYPFRKVPSHLDVTLAPDTDDSTYLAVLEETLERIPQKTDILFYQAGVDVLKTDKLGSFALSLEGVRRRDRRVFEWARARQIPVVTCAGGGYADPISDTVEAYRQTIVAARDILFPLR